MEKDRKNTLRSYFKGFFEPHQQLKATSSGQIDQNAEPSRTMDDAQLLDEPEDGKSSYGRNGNSGDKQNDKPGDEGNDGSSVERDESSDHRRDDLSDDGDDNTRSDELRDDPSQAAQPGSSGPAVTKDIASRLKGSQHAKTGLRRRRSVSGRTLRVVVNHDGHHVYNESSAISQVEEPRLLSENRTSDAQVSGTVLAPSRARYFSWKWLLKWLLKWYFIWLALSYSTVPMRRFTVKNYAAVSSTPIVTPWFVEYPDLYNIDLYNTNSSYINSHGGLIWLTRYVGQLYNRTRNIVNDGFPVQDLRSRIEASSIYGSNDEMSRMFMALNYHTEQLARASSKLAANVCTMADTVGRFDESAVEGLQAIAAKQAKLPWLILRILFGLRPLGAFDGDWREYKVKRLLVPPIQRINDTVNTLLQDYYKLNRTAFNVLQSIRQISEVPQDGFETMRLVNIFNDFSPGVSPADYHKHYQEYPSHIEAVEEFYYFSLLHALEIGAALESTRGFLGQFRDVLAIPGACLLGECLKMHLEEITIKTLSVVIRLLKAEKTRLESIIKGKVRKS